MSERNDKHAELQRAWSWREERGVLAETGALRVFHGPGEGQGALTQLAIDRFVCAAGPDAGDHYWLTFWEREGRGAAGGNGARETQAVRDAAVAFLREKGAASVVELGRPEKGVPGEPVALYGKPPEGRFEVTEVGRYWIQLQGARHPGLFLDHAPLRHWLRARARGWRVLNLFAYTGSLSVAAGLGGAEHVTTLDLSKSTVDWAHANWTLNRFPDASARFISGDVFEWLPRLAREKRIFDCIILDPPSFSRGKKGSFSTAKDLTRLHALAFDLLAPGGVVATSINSAQIPRQRFEADVLAAARASQLSFEVLSEIQQPETFLSPLGSAPERYLKGWVLRAR